MDGNLTSGRGCSRREFTMVGSRTRVEHLISSSFLSCDQKDMINLRKNRSAVLQTTSTGKFERVKTSSIMEGSSSQCICIKSIHINRIRGHHHRSREKM
jgi:hypothetical protein